jgi:hypothetical protein
MATLTVTVAAPPLGMGPTLVVEARGVPAQTRTMTAEALMRKRRNFTKIN